jgi:hypothetical protein
MKPTLARKLLAEGQAGIINRHKGWEKQDKEIRKL